MLAAGQVVAAVAQRITGLSLAGSAVFTDRTWPLSETQLPAWKVLAADESVAPMTIHPDPVFAHELQVEMHGFAQGVSGLDAALNGLASEALTAIFRTSGTPDALDAIDRKLQLSLRRIERSMTKEGEAAMGLVLITLRANFKTRASAPDTLI
jgi:hypothetical protein